MSGEFTIWWYECSECGERPEGTICSDNPVPSWVPSLKYYGSGCLSRFCPNCGAKMNEPIHSKVIETENVQDMYDMGFADKMR